MIHTQPQKYMNKSTKMMIACAAMAGLYTGALAVKASASTAKAGTAIVKSDEKSKHDCKGKNDCKGQGGCKAGSDNGCKGKNSCKGKGGCSTAEEPKK
jgi:hypothetical protein